MAESSTQSGDAFGGGVSLEEESRDIAVIGMAGRFPGASDLEAFWGNLEAGVEGITFFSDEDLLEAGVSEKTMRDSRYVRAASLLDGVEDFDAEFFGYTAREAEILDPQQRLFLETCWHSLENAGCDPQQFEGLIGIYAGVAWNTYLLSNLTTHRELFEGGGAFQVFITNDKDFMPTRVSYKLNLKGPSVILQTSCSTSLVAVHLACLSLLNYECDLSLVGGVTVKVPQAAGYHYMDGGLASPDGHCRAFDARAAGTIFGSGVGVVTLKRLADALEDGDRIRAVIRGSAINNDGSAKVSYTAPSVEGQAEVIASAQAVAGVEPRSISYVEAHGTGTSLGDPIEVTALSKVFRESTEDKEFCALGSVKTNIGHLDAAAGIAGFIKTVLALEHRTLPPSLNFETPNPAIDFQASPFYVNSTLRAWEPGPGVPRRAGVSSFGVGGTNAHVILEEFGEARASGPSRDYQLLLISARSSDALETATDQLETFLQNDDVPPLADVAFTLRRGRATFRHRRALVAASPQEAAKVLSLRDSRSLWSGDDVEEPRRRPVVFLLSGQGSQYPGMGASLYRSESVYRNAFEECLSGLDLELGNELRPLLLAPETVADAAEQLQQTRLAQPALFALEYSLARLWESWGVEATAYLGHSVGEIVAACLAGVISLRDALRLVAARGALMQELAPGAMLAVPLGEAELEPYLGLELSLAAVNEPDRCVASGPIGAIEDLVQRLAADGIAARSLHTSHAFHSAMMDPILEPFRQLVSSLELRAPERPIISNATGDWLTKAQAQDPEYWVGHLRHPVRFSAGVERALEDPERILLEVGPGRTLTTLAGRHRARQGQPVVASLRHPQDPASPLDGVLAAMARLWIAGLYLDAGLFFADEHRLRVEIPKYPFQRRRYWIEADERLRAGNSSGQKAGGVSAYPSATLSKEPDLDSWFYLPGWLPSLSPVPDGPLPECWLVFEDEDGVAGAVIQLLRSQGHSVSTVRVGSEFAQVQGARSSGLDFVIDPRVSQHYQMVIQELEAHSVLPEVVLHCWSISVAEQPALGFDEAQDRGFFSIAELLKALAGSPAPRQLLAVGSGLLAVGPGEALMPEKAPLKGLLRVLPQEYPQWTSKLVDLGSLGSGALPQTQPHLAERLLAEIMGSEAEDVIALRGHQRFVPAYRQVALKPSLGTPPSPLRDQGVYLLTGGLEGNGFAFAKTLAAKARARLVILERSTERGEGSTEAPQGEVPISPARNGATLERRGKRLQQIRDLGGEVVVVEGNLDAHGFRDAVTQGEKLFGDLHGVFHTAGTHGEETFLSIGEIDREAAEWHFGTKSRPLYELERVLADRLEAGKQLDFCVLLSSMASLLGGFAYGAYAAANAFQEAFVAEHNRHSSLPWLALSWDVLEFEDETEQITTLRKELTDIAMSPAEGGEALLRSLSQVDHLLVSTVSLPDRLAQRQGRIDELRGRATSVGQKRGSRHPRPELPNPFVPPASELEESFTDIWKSFLGFEEIGVEDNFFELGGDSFIAVQVVSRIKDDLGVELAVAKLYQGLTIRSLAALLEEDGEEAAQERADHLEGRRKSMSRRRDFQARRRAGRRS